MEVYSSVKSKNLGNIVSRHTNSWLYHPRQCKVARVFFLQDQVTTQGSLDMALCTTCSWDWSRAWLVCQIFHFILMGYIQISILLGSKTTQDHTENTREIARTSLWQPATRKNRVATLLLKKRNKANVNAFFNACCQFPQ